MWYLLQVAERPAPALNDCHAEVINTNTITLYESDEEHNEEHNALTTRNTCYQGTRNTRIPALRALSHLDTELFKSKYTQILSRRAFVKFLYT